MQHKQNYKPHFVLCCDYASVDCTAYNVALDDRTPTTACDGASNNGTAFNVISDDGAVFICTIDDRAPHAPPPASASITPSTSDSLS